MSTALQGSEEPPWRKPSKASNKYGKYAVSATAPSAESGKQPVKRKPKRPGDEEERHSMFELDPEIRAAFAKNFQFLGKIFSIDNIFSPLPYPMRQGLARNLGFLTRVFTQFSDPNGIKNARRSIGLENESDRPSFHNRRRD